MKDSNIPKLREQAFSMIREIVEPLFDYEVRYANHYSKSFHILLSHNKIFSDWLEIRLDSKDTMLEDVENLQNVYTQLIPEIVNDEIYAKRASLVFNELKSYMASIEKTHGGRCSLERYSDKFTALYTKDGSTYRERNLAFNDLEEIKWYFKVFAEGAIALDSIERSVGPYFSKYGATLSSDMSAIYHFFSNSAIRKYVFSGTKTDEFSYKVYIDPSDDFEALQNELVSYFDNCCTVYKVMKSAIEDSLQGYQIPYSISFDPADCVIELNNRRYYFSIESIFSNELKLRIKELKQIVKTELYRSILIPAYCKWKYHRKDTLYCFEMISSQRAKIVVYPPKGRKFVEYVDPTKLKEIYISEIIGMLSKLKKSQLETVLHSFLQTQ